MFLNGFFLFFYLFAHRSNPRSAKLLQDSPYPAHLYPLIATNISFESYHLGVTIPFQDIIQ